MLGVDLPGGMQEYWAVPATRLLKVPDELGDDQAALIEPLAIAVHDVRRAGVKRDDAVLVFGGGPIGTLIGLVARNLGARVAVVEVNRFRLDMLERFGLPTVGPTVRSSAGPTTGRAEPVWTSRSRSPAMPPRPAS